ncbi:MAG: HlyD family efflux transporter periplasmic adaptor subunit [Solirubrobacterales bacterium]|nr:HlyD family efflux transporter periplasmic adaptor subunit [Solirubrobacterales bacterium]
MAAAAVAVAVLAITEIGPPTSSARTSREVVTAEQGVAQSTVTGSGNIAAGTDVNVNFNTSGTLQDVYVHSGQQVHAGQLLADLDPTSADLSLSQAEESLTAAEDNLSCLQGVTSDCGSGGSGSSGSTSGGSSGSSSGGSASTTSYSAPARTVEYAAFHPGTTPGASTKTPKPGSTTTVKKTPSVTVTVVVPSTSRTGSSGAASTSTPKTTSTTTTSTTPSPGSVASAQAAVYSAQAGVHNAETAVTNTKLYAPVSGTIASLSSLTPGDAVSGGSGSSSSGSSSSSSSGSGSGSGTTAGSLGGSGSSGSGSSSSSGFAEIVNTGTLTMTVAFSESDISKVHVGQPATVTLDALSGVELAAHVSSISLVGTTSSSVVSYNATLTLDQNDSRVKPGMSASAAVTVGQAQGVTLPNAAVTGSSSLATVNMLKAGKTVAQQVVVGLRGDSRTQIISGLNPGDQVVITVALPSLSSTSTTGSGTGALGRGLGGGLGGGGLGGGGLGGGGGAFLRRAAGGG